jgi:hypothetical protein
MREGKEGVREGEERGERRSGLGQEFEAAFFLFSFPFLFSKLNLFTQIHLNSIKFELKPYNSTQTKIMLQHECTNNLIL